MISKFKNKIIQGDCLDVMKKLPNNSIDLIIADPPYGISFRSNNRKNQFDYIINDNTVNVGWLSEAFRVLRSNSAMYCYTRWDVYPTWMAAIKSVGFKIKNIIVWSKGGGGMGDLTGAYAPTHEFIIYAVKGRHLLNGKRISDVWEVRRDPASKYLHPTQKPIQLASTIINKSTNENGVVLIPFVGSGNDCIASLENKRSFIGVEMEKKYVDIARRRLQDVKVGAVM